MPEYKAKAKTWISHECRMVHEGEKFTTTFPKVKTKDGEVEMRLSDNLEEVKEEKADKPAKGDKKGDGASGLV